MAEIKTPNWRLSSVMSTTSTDCHYQLTDRRVDTVVYFDTVKVFDVGCMNRIRLYSDSDKTESGRGRAATYKNTDQFPDVILDALKHLEDGGTLSDLGTRVNE